MGFFVTGCIFFLTPNQQCRSTEITPVLHIGIQSTLNFTVAGYMYLIVV